MFRVPPNIVVVAIESDACTLFNMETLAAVTLNATAMSIWSLAQKFERLELVSELENQFEVGSDAAQRAADTTLEGLVKDGWLVES